MTTAKRIEELPFPPEMQALMRRHMVAHLVAWWRKNATAEQEAKRKADGKSFEGAWEFLRSVAEAHAKQSQCAVIPDEVAFWILMEYMENQPEGALYRKNPEQRPTPTKRAKKPATEPTPAPTPAQKSNARIAERMGQMTFGF
jgi:hypothetical protein